MPLFVAPAQFTLADDAMTWVGNCYALEVRGAEGQTGVAAFQAKLMRGKK